MIWRLAKGCGKKLSKNFNSKEFDCHCNNVECTYTMVSEYLIKQLQSKRELLGRSIKILSGFRCDSHNKKIGGKQQSQHLVGNAADISIDGMSPHKLADRCEDFKGLGRYDKFTHVDVRPGKRARWKE